MSALTPAACRQDCGAANIEAINARDRCEEKSVFQRWYQACYRCYQEHTDDPKAYLELSLIFEDSISLCGMPAPSPPELVSASSSPTTPSGMINVPATYLTIYVSTIWTVTSLPGRPPVSTHFTTTVTELKPKPHLSSPTTQSLPASPTPENSTSSVPSGTIAGGTIGGLLGIVLILGVLMHFDLRRRREKQQNGDTNSYIEAPETFEGTKDRCLVQKMDMQELDTRAEPVAEIMSHEKVELDTEPNTRELDGNEVPERGSSMTRPSLKIPHLGVNDVSTGQKTNQ